MTTRSRQSTGAWLDYELMHALGTNAALLIDRINFFIEYHQGKEMEIDEDQREHYHDGRWWTWNTYTQWARVLGYKCTSKTIQRIVTRLEDLGLITTSSEYNKKGYDRTKWYAINDDAYQEFLALWRRMGQPSCENTKSNPRYDAFLEAWEELRSTLGTPCTQAEEAPGDTVTPGAEDTVYPGPGDTVTPPIPESPSRKSTEKKDGPQRPAAPSDVSAANRRNRPTGAAGGTPATESHAEPAGEERELHKYIRLSFKRPPNKKLRSALDAPLEYLDPITNKPRELPAPVDYYDENPDYAKWLRERIDYYRSEIEEKGVSVHTVQKRLGYQAHKVTIKDDPHWSYFAWREKMAATGKAQPLQVAEEGYLPPIEGVELGNWD